MSTSSGPNFGITPFQEPKYGIDLAGRLFNRYSGEPIPDTEPVFILRAQDRQALPTLQYYLRLIGVETHRRAVEIRIEQFGNWKKKNGVKTPDTIITESFRAIQTQPPPDSNVANSEEPEKPTQSYDDEVLGILRDKMKEKMKQSDPRGAEQYLGLLSHWEQRLKEKLKNPGEVCTAGEISSGEIAGTVTPCCGYRYTHEGRECGPIFWNPLNKVVQCHACGQAFYADCVLRPEKPTVVEPMGDKVDRVIDRAVARSTGANLNDDGGAQGPAPGHVLPLADQALQLCHALDKLPTDATTDGVKRSAAALFERIHRQTIHVNMPIPPAYIQQSAAWKEEIEKAIDAVKRGKIAWRQRMGFVRQAIHENEQSAERTLCAERLLDAPNYNPRGILIRLQEAASWLDVDMQNYRKPRTMPTEGEAQQPGPTVPEHVRMTKQWRKELDEVIQAARKGCVWWQDAARIINEIVSVPCGPSQRERQNACNRLRSAGDYSYTTGNPETVPLVVIDLITEAYMWLGMDLKAYDAAHPGSAPNPYPHSKDPTSPIVDKTDGGARL
jgi:hypothetical protein